MLNRLAFLTIACNAIQQKLSEPFQLTKESTLLEEGVENIVHTFTDGYHGDLTVYGKAERSFVGVRTGKFAYTLNDGD